MDAFYLLRVKGHLPADWSEWLDQFEIICEPDGATSLTGPIRDQAELYGLVARFQNLGLTLISINQISESTIKEGPRP
jgi:hypothetical protein